MGNMLLIVLKIKEFPKALVNTLLLVLKIQRISKADSVWEITKSEGDKTFQG